MNLLAISILPKNALMVLYVLLGIMVFLSIVLTALCAKRKMGKSAKTFLLGATYVVTVAVLLCTVICVRKYDELTSGNVTIQTPSTAAPTSEPTEAPTTEPVTEPVTEPTVPEPTFTAAFTDVSNPANWKVDWKIYQDKERLDTFTRDGTISFGKGSDYAALEGVFTFRGNNYRDGAAYGTAEIVNYTLTKLWSNRVGSLQGSHSNWGGCGWTGQPSVVRWDAETKAIMNLKEDSIFIVDDNHPL